MTLCSYFNTIIDEIKAAVTTAGHDYFNQEESVRALGRIHYIIWLNDLHKKPHINSGDFLLVSFIYFIDVLPDVALSPFNIVICRRR